jgi:hypothetical protein
MFVSLKRASARHAEALCGCRFISFIEPTEVLFVFPYRGEGLGLPTFSTVSGRGSWHSHEFRAILCAIPCVGNESRAQRIANRSRDFTENTGDFAWSGESDGASCP